MYILQTEISPKKLYDTLLFILVLRRQLLLYTGSLTIFELCNTVRGAKSYHKAEKNKYLC